jgi:hypothetical protein
MPVRWGTNLRAERYRSSRNRGPPRLWCTTEGNRWRQLKWKVTGAAGGVDDQHITDVELVALMAEMEGGWNGLSAWRWSTAAWWRSFGSGGVETLEVVL